MRQTQADIGKIHVAQPFAMKSSCQNLPNLGRAPVDFADPHRGSEERGGGEADSERGESGPVNPPELLRIWASGRLVVSSGGSLMPLRAAVWCKASSLQFHRRNLQAAFLHLRIFFSFFVFVDSVSKVTDVESVLSPLNPVSTSNQPPQEKLFPGKHSVTHVRLKYSPSSFG